MVNDSFEAHLYQKWPNYMFTSSQHQIKWHLSRSILQNQQYSGKKNTKKTTFYDVLLPKHWSQRRVLIFFSPID